MEQVATAPTTAPVNITAPPPDTGAQLSQQYQDVTQRTKEQLAPLNEQGQKIGESIQQEAITPPPAPPQLQSLPVFQPREITGQEKTQFAGVVAAIAGLAGLATRAPLTAALNSAGAAMEGYNKGSIQQADLDLKNFNMQMVRAKEQNDQTMQQYNAVMENKKYSLSQKMQLWRVIAAEKQDVLAQAALDKGDIRMFLDRNDKLNSGFAKMLSDAQTLHEKIRHNLSIEENAKKRIELMGAGVGSAGDFGPEDVARAVANYQLAPPTGFALRSPYWQKIMQDVMRINPQYDATIYTARQAARRTFASGPEAKNVTALNTVIGHLGTLNEMANALNNQDVRTVNMLTNTVKQELGDPSIVNFDTARQAVAEETMRVFRQVGASEHEAKIWADLISSKSSPSQLQGNISTLGHLLESRIKAIAQQYERTVQNSGNPAQVDPQNKAVLDKLMGGGGANTGPQEGQTGVSKSGRPTVYRNGQWVYQ